MSKPSYEPMLEMYIFETIQLLEQLEQNIIGSEKSNSYSSQDINEIFRIMHTIKGSSAMMLFNGITALAHSLEDLLYYIREKKPKSVSFTELTDLILKGADYIKNELAEIEESGVSNNDSGALIEEIRIFLEDLKKLNASSALFCEEAEKTILQEKQRYYIGSAILTEASFKQIYKAVIHFEEGCQMENVRAFTIIHNIKDLVNEIYYIPSNIIEDDRTEEIIKKDGFKIYFRTDSIDSVSEILMQTIFLKHIELKELEDEDEIIQIKKGKQIVLDEASTSEPKEADKERDVEKQSKAINQSMISVNILKLDTLLDLVGELVISESMVTQNSDLHGLSLDNFRKAARQLRKITGELQDTVMSIRMVPLTATFQKVNRILRDMSKKLDKNVQLVIIGEETEVDKNIIENISDPLMHLIRNAIDHGIESAEKRVSAGKDKTGKITLEAKNAGGEVLIIIKDDGMGLDKEKILNKARNNGLINRPESDLTDREIFSFIFLPGFSTKDNVSEFSGRGVGMDVVTKNIGKIGGTVNVDSITGRGTTVTIKIPLTLAIIGGIKIKTGNSIYTVPITSISESFRPCENDIIRDPDGNEMIIIRGQCCPILRLHKHYGVKTDIVSIHEGIIIVVEDDAKTICIFADELLGEQQVVVKALPSYIKKVKGVAGCTLLGDGGISLILDVAGLISAE